jgi:hypothetical protein
MADALSYCDLDVDELDPKGRDCHCCYFGCCYSSEIHSLFSEMVCDLHHSFELLTLTAAKALPSASSRICGLERISI